MLTPAQVRARAARIVAAVNSEGKSLDALLSESKDTQERGLLRSLVYGTIRWQIRLEAFLERFSAQPQSKLDPHLRALLLVGLYQLLQTDIAVHAAVAETVEATRAIKQPRAAGFVNAVLRRCQREGRALATQIDADVSRRTAHPQWLVEALRRDWPERHCDILDANNAHPPMWLRVNRKRGTVEAYLDELRAAGLDAERNAFAPEALRLVTPVDVHGLPGFDSGDVSVQDAAAQLAAHLLAPQPGDRILDACAAPGGKTCHLLELEPRVAELVAVDISAERVRRIRENLERLRLQATAIAGDALDPNAWWDGRLFQRILLDAPCSATGVIRRHPDIKLLRRARDIDELHQRQMRMLTSVWPLLAPGGRLLYASCSALKAETTEVIDRFLLARSDARETTAAACAHVPPGAALLRPGVTGLVVHAGEAQMDGFYYACLEKHH